MRSCYLLFLALACLLIQAHPVGADLTATVTTFAEGVAKPGILTFGGDFLYVGNDDNTTTVPIGRVASDGSVTSYGDPLWDPDAVVYDTDGDISIAGSVLVGGGSFNVAPYIITIDPDDQSTSRIFTLSAHRNPTDMVFDSTGRLLIVDPGYGVYQTTGSNPTELFTPPALSDHIEIDVSVSDRIYVSTRDGTICVYESDGSLVDSTFASGFGSIPVPMAFGPGSHTLWGDDLYVLGNGSLLRFDRSGAFSEIATDFAFENTGYSDIVFGFDGMLYVGDYTHSRILEINPVPVPGAFVLGSIGITFAGWLCRRRTTG